MFGPSLHLSISTILFILCGDLHNHIIKSKKSMGAAVSKDGWITNIVEVIPFGGCFTAPFHAFASNGQ